MHKEPNKKRGIKLMKLNKWTLGLAALGLVSLAPGAMAQTNAPAPAPIPLTTALTATTISGYVDTSMVWNPGSGNANPAPYSFNAGKQDGFNLDSADVKIQRSPDSGKWTAGYTLELQYGNDVVTGDAPLRQAYVELMAPIGNGLDLEIGQWDSIIGYESNDDYKNPNWSRSYGYTIEPTTHTGILATYKFSDAVSLEVGLANSLSSVGLNARNFSGGSGGGLGTGPGSYTIESKKAIVSLLSLTAPDSWGSLKGSGLYIGLDYGPGNALSDGTSPQAHIVDKTHLYVGATINTPVKGLTFGAAYDVVNNFDAGPVEGAAMALGVYSSYALTDKATLNARAEYAHGSGLDALFPLPAGVAYGVAGGPQEAEVFAVTGTLAYQLWDNVTSRIEARWDTSADGYAHFGGTAFGAPTKKNDVMVAANLIYKF
jgi:hypothetical protein